MEKKDTAIQFSIIIPVFNTMKYLKDCLDSVICQAVGDIELIIIDDASTDGSVDFIRQFEDANRGKLQIKTLYHAENKGQAVARNEGIDLAEGRYILFLDSDDMIRSDALGILKNEIGNNENPDILFFDAVIINETDIKRNDDQYNRSGMVIEKLVKGIDYMENWYFSPLIVSCCMCVFRRNYLSETGLRFREGFFHEDNAFSIISTLYASGVRYIDQKLYIRRYRCESTMTGEVTKKHLIGKIRSVSDITDAFDISWKSRQKLFNKILNYLCRDSNNTICHYRDGRIEKEYVEEYMNGLLYFMLEGVDPDQEGYTWYTAVQSVLDNMYQCGLEIKLDNIISLRRQLSDDYVYLIAKRREALRTAAIQSLPLSDKEKSIGIFGVGNHTKNIIHRFLALENIKADIFFIDSAVDNKSEILFLGRPIVNPNVIPKDVSMIILSSYNYHTELLRMCRKIEQNLHIPILDLYETEAMALDLI